MQKKLQVFVSSTFEDLKEERQKAVEAILNNNHIPAGMELFKASNESQLDTVKKWIQESDIYMLLLGGRYGSIEPHSGLSYTEVEYDYAIEQNIPVFSLILTEGYTYGKLSSDPSLRLLEETYQEKYEAFKRKVKTKMIKEINSLEEIATEIGNSITYLKNDPSIEFRGWVRPHNLNDLFQSKSELNSDKELFEEIINFFEEEDNLNRFELIATHCAYDDKTREKLDLVIRNSERASKEFLNEEIQSYYEDFLREFKRFNNYLIKSFFTRRGLSVNRYYLYPDLNPDFSFPEDPDKYYKYVRELNDAVEEMVEAYKIFIRKARRILG